MRTHHLLEASAPPEASAEEFRITVPERSWRLDGGGGVEDGKPSEEDGAS